MQKIFIYIVILIFVTSCYSNKELIYLQDETYSNKIPKPIENQRPIYKIHANDVLHIDIKTPDAETTALFSLQDQNRGGGFNASPAMFYIRGYSVDDEGNVALPLIGKVPVAELSIQEVKSKIQSEVDRYLTNASVEVKLVSFKISVNGEVNNPGYYYVYNGQANLLEGLSLAGDLTEFASRKDIKLIRQTEKGSEVILLDLTDPSVLQSPYYYLLPNDVIYVQHSEKQIKNQNLRPLGVFFAGLSAAVLLANFIINQL
jgi:polysaccharide biosynthesis/export protein